MSIVDAIGWLDSYVTRQCISGGSNTSVSASVAEWVARRDHWVTMAISFLAL
jgi:hypothetical protein